MYEKLGFTQKEWEIYKAEAREILIRIASQRGMITYGDLATQMATIQIEPHDKILWEIIGDVGRDEASAGRGILSVLVVHKNGDMEPGHGFYQLAEYFKRNLTDRQKCFVEELHKVHSAWA